MTTTDDFGIEVYSKKKITDLTSKYNTKMEDSNNRFSVFTRTYCDGFDLGLTDKAQGIPQGASISFYAEPGTGKTTIAADIIKRILTMKEKNNEPYRVLYIDCEGSRQLLSSMGLDPFIDSRRLIYFDNVNTFTELEELYSLVLTPEAEMFNEVKLIVVDSMTAMQSLTKLNKEVDGGDFGSNAKERSNFYPKFLPRCRTAGVTSIFIAQVRCNIGAQMFESKTKAATTHVDNHYMDFIVNFTKSTSSSQNGIIKRKVLTATGGEIEVVDRFRLNMSTAGKGRKNRFGDIPDVTLLVKPGKKVINSFTIIELLKNLKLITGTAASYKLDPELKELLQIDDNKNTGFKGKELNKLIRENISIIRNRLIETDRYRSLIDVVDTEGDGLDND